MFLVDLKPSSKSEWMPDKSTHPEKDWSQANQIALLRHNYEN